MKNFYSLMKYVNKKRRTLLSIAISNRKDIKLMSQIFNYFEACKNYHALNALAIYMKMNRNQLFRRFISNLND